MLGEIKAQRQESKLKRIDLYSKEFPSGFVFFFKSDNISLAFCLTGDGDIQLHGVEEDQEKSLRPRFARWFLRLSIPKKWM